MNAYYCDQCPGVELKLIERLKNTKPKKGYPYGFRVRRFVCPICDTPKTIFAGGERDDIIHPIILQDQLKQMYNQEKENRN